MMIFDEIAEMLTKIILAIIAAAFFAFILVLFWPLIVLAIVVEAVLSIFGIKTNIIRKSK